MRQPIVAGRFYSGTERGCQEHLKRVDAGPLKLKTLPAEPVAAVVPHAGWDCSGHVAMKVYRTIAQHLPADVTFVVFGSVHTFGVAKASVYARGGWVTPITVLPVDEELAALLIRQTDGLLADNVSAHMAEHSIEVQTPMLKYIFPESRIVAIAAPPRGDSHELGRRVAEVLQSAGRKAFVIGTTDLTHYGEFGYGFAPKGPGKPGLEWVKTVNDRRMIDLMSRLAAEDVVAEARSNQNACGSGAVAATLAAARQLGSRGGHLVEYTTSYDVLRKAYGDAISDFVGYVGMIF